MFIQEIKLNRTQDVEWVKKANLVLINGLNYLKMTSKPIVIMWTQSTGLSYNLVYYMINIWLTS